MNAKINQVESDQRAKYNEEDEKYDPEFIKNWDFIQKKFRCCGFKSTREIPYFAHKKQFDNKCVPKACCINEDDCVIPDDKCNWPRALPKIFNEGCLTVMQRRYTV